MSKPVAVRWCNEFALMNKDLYSLEYLRVPDENDLKGICRLHCIVHGVNGMIGSLDCMHTQWKSYPKAWQASFKSGKESGGPTVVLKAMSDYHLLFWHASFGYTGSLNNLNVLNLLPFLESLVDGSFKASEEAAGAVPFMLVGRISMHCLLLLKGFIPGRETLLPCAGSLLFTFLVFLLLPVLLLLVLLNMTSSSSVLLVSA